MKRFLLHPIVGAVIAGIFVAAAGSFVLWLTDWPAFWTRMGVAVAFMMGLALYVFLSRHRQNRRRDAEAIQGTE